MPQEHQIRMHSDECEYIYLFLQNIFLFHNQLAVTKFCKTVAITGKMFSIEHAFIRKRDGTKEDMGTRLH